MKFSVILLVLVQHSSCCTNPRASATAPAKAALPEEKLLPVAALSLLSPLRMCSGMLPKVGQMEREGAENNLQPPYLLHLQSWGVSAHLTPPGTCGSRGESQPSPPWPTGKARVPLPPRLSGCRGGSRIQAVPLGK